MHKTKVLKPLWFYVSAGFAVALILFGAARASSPVIDAIEATDVVKLEALSANAATEAERGLANATVLALRHKDGEALARLDALARGAADKDVRAAAYRVAACVYLRQSRFADVAKALEASPKIGGVPLSHSEVQTLNFAQALAQVVPMSVVRREAGELAITRDLAGMVRVPVGINGAAVDAIVDSGAGFSTMSESTASKMGVTLLARGVSVGSSSREDVATRLGVAKQLRFGDAVLRDVVFIVLPDSALTFADGKYKIEAIIGLPVFEALGRIELAHDGDKEVLRYGSRPDAPARANMILDGVQPIVLAEVGGARLRLFVDTGANATTLNGSVPHDFPELMTSAVKKPAKFAGAGGVSEDADAMALPALHLTIAGRGIDLKDVAVHSKATRGRHGDIGQDVLTQGKRWSLDFEHMSFAVED